MAGWFLFHPLIRAWIGFKTIRNATQDFAGKPNQLVGVGRMPTPI
jgi:hypothetical protein